VTLTPAQLRALLPAGCPAFFCDDGYDVPAAGWLLEEFYPWFWQMRTALGLRAYARKNDCDNFARAAASAAQDCHALTPSAPGGLGGAQALAVGEFWYQRAAGEGAHAICVQVTPGGSLSFFEPQSGRSLALTPEEIKSCYFVRF
jgi:hypothetical protein